MKSLIARLVLYLKILVARSGELIGNRHRSAEIWLLIIRNTLVAAAVVLFLLSIFHITHRFLWKAIAYIFGAGAYLSEILILTDFFSKRIPFKEKFMAYCFGGLYLLMAVSYFIEHLEN